MSTPLNKPRDATSPPPSPGPEALAPVAETCDLCGSESVEWRSCKLVCLSCRAIVRSCADL